MDAVTRLFCQLVSIPSPSGREGSVAREVQSHLAKVGIQSRFDATGELNDSDTGNLIAVLQGTPNAPTVMFVAHLDTVEDGTERIQPVVENGVVRSRGNTILGADNKAAVAALVRALVLIKPRPVRPTVVAVFTTREEEGRMGAAMLSLHRKIDYAFSIDGAYPVGTIIKSALGQVPFTLNVRGRESHSALAPDRGVDAIQLAAEIIRRVSPGQAPTGDSVNFGVITGGSRVNTIAGAVDLLGEVRSYSDAGLESQLNRVRRISEEVAAESPGSTVALVAHTEDGVPPFRQPAQHKVLTIARRASGEVGIDVVEKEARFCTEANFLAARGFPTLGLATGGRYPHSKDEEISVRELNQLTNLITSLALAVLP